MQFSYAFFFKVMLPDDDGNPTGRGITFFDFAGIWTIFPKLKHSKVELEPFEKNTFFPPDPLK
jgi:hypothetical protein